MEAKKIETVPCVGRRRLDVSITEEGMVAVRVRIARSSKVIATLVLDPSSASGLRTALNRACNMLGA